MFRKEKASQRLHSSCMTIRNYSAQNYWCARFLQAKLYVRAFKVVKDNLLARCTYKCTLREETQEEKIGGHKEIERCVTTSERHTIHVSSASLKFIFLLDWRCLAGLIHYLYMLRLEVKQENDTISEKYTYLCTFCIKHSAEFQSQEFQFFRLSLAKIFFFLKKRTVAVGYKHSVCHRIPVWLLVKIIFV